MEDQQIIDLYFTRSETAIAETERKYGNYCRTIAGNILRDDSDSEECVSDTWLRAWNVIPPQRPNILRAFFAKITRNLALDRCRRGAAKKRGGGELISALEELGDCVSGGDLESELERKALAEAINGFLRGLEETERELFLRRYWLTESVGEIAKRSGITANAVSLRLMRLRARLRETLEKEGISV